jgi:hypothetical protein
MPTSTHTETNGWSSLSRPDLDKLDQRTAVAIEAEEQIPYERQDQQ